MVKIDGNTLRNMIMFGAQALCSKKDEIDAMNVFPVPDGDTGTNMSLTVAVAAKEIEPLVNKTVSDIAGAVSGGALRGARGNSGVIMSQLFRGFAKGLKDHDEAGAEELATALSNGVETAYKAVMKPKEGTILTVAKAIAKKAEEVSFYTDEIDVFLKEIIGAGNEMLLKTTEMLPQLKQAGVVDAGGAGLLCFLTGCLQSLDSSSPAMDFTAFVTPVEETVPKAVIAASPGDIEFGYCTEFFIISDSFSEADEDSIKQFLSENGDSVVAVHDDALMKVHVHTNHPGRVMEKALTYGELSNVKIENMRIQHTEIISFMDKSPVYKKEIGFVAVAAGSGLERIFTSLGADAVIKGGQTMNPSADDILAAAETVSARKVIILPNNKNIVLAAKQACFLESAREMYVVPTETIPEGLTALVHFTPFSDVFGNLDTMSQAAKSVKTGNVTYAVRDSVIDGQEIKAGDILCMDSSAIVFTDIDYNAGALRLIERLAGDDAEIISIYYGEDVPEEKALILEHKISKMFPDVEIECLYGGQPLYYYIISIE